MTMLHKSIVFACAVSAMASAALAGPNAGGVILLHVDDALVYTDDHGSYCSDFGLVECGDASARTDQTEPTVVFALAAFPHESTPQVLGLTFGIAFDPNDLEVVDFGHCADREGNTTPNWPGPGEGTALSWDEAQTDRLLKFYWFAVYWTARHPSSLRLQPHPTQDGMFLGPGPTDPLDPIADYGELGFGTDGYLPCPDGPVPTQQATWGGLKNHFR